MAQPFFMTIVGWLQFAKVQLWTVPLTSVAVNGLSVEKLVSELVHVSVVVPNSSLIMSEVPLARDIATATELFLATPPTSSVVADAVPTEKRAIAANAKREAKPRCLECFIVISLIDRAGRGGTQGVLTDSGTIVKNI